MFEKIYSFKKLVGIIAKIAANHHRIFIHIFGYTPSKQKVLNVIYKILALNIKGIFHIFHIVFNINTPGFNACQTFFELHIIFFYNKKYKSFLSARNMAFFNFNLRDKRKNTVYMYKSIFGKNAVI